MSAIQRTSNTLTAFYPISRGITMVSRPPSSTGRRPWSSCTQASTRSSTSNSVDVTADPYLSNAEIENIVFQRVKEKQTDLRKAFRVYDVENNLTVTTGEFRRVVESFIQPLTDAQFSTLLKKVPMKNTWTVFYEEFLGKCCRLSTANSRCRSSGDNPTMTLAEIQLRLKDKISRNLKNIIRAFRLFDYNRDGLIQMHEFRRVLESYCFRMANKEFTKLWSHYTVGNTCTLDYKEFLKKLGLNCEAYSRPVPESTKLVLNWEAVQHEQQKLLKNKKPATPSDVISVEGLTLDEIVLALRKKILAHYVDIEKSLQAFDHKKSGFVSSSDLKSVLSSFVFPMSDNTFQRVLSWYGFRENGGIPWEKFISMFREPMMTRRCQTAPTKTQQKVSLFQEPSEQFSTRDILQKLREHVQAAYPSLKKAFLVFDDNRDGKITRPELRRILEGLTFRMTDNQFKELMILLDPEHTGIISYHRFLELFELKESMEGHKWLNGVHEAPTVKDPEVSTLALKTVEGILADKISDNWKEIIKAFKCYDSAETGCISQKALLKILQTYCLRLSDEHFEDNGLTVASFILGTLPYEYKIVIAGNHELTFDQEFMADLIKQDFYYFPSASKLKSENYENVQSLLTNCIYLQDSEVTVRGFRIYGSPWQPWYNGWGFNLPRGQALLDKWNLIPDGTDVLITHGPPLGFLDWVPKQMQRAGCMELLNTVQRRVQPKLHVFGHIHEGYGVMTDGGTIYVNASACTVNFQPMNPAIVIDLPTPRST
ncbi:EF-hand calcium-binding domain-containing protein 6-like [Polypterus senegalus]|uniref:EF-hand calcium-binding domain-containing protein 6-like n=1 Tax=Polypterus senegalus TaxID=55291 RepID=UPI001965F794|nr:EF-hand calcium-binding domain-containing protein 6-like [Polypterus senegalus]